MAFQKIVGTNSGTIYAITATGELLWYQDLKQDGTNGSAAQSGWHVNSGSQIGIGWENFRHVFSGGNGIIYAIKPSGELLWYQDLKQDGTNGSVAESGWHVNSGSQIGIGWENFKHVFSEGNGIIYAIKPGGELLWYQDLIQDGTNGSFAERGWNVNSGKTIGTGWYSVSIGIFSGGNGVIYLLSPDGFLLYYKDLKRNGEISWDANSRNAIGCGWLTLNISSKKIQGYANKLSVLPGDTIEFKVSADCSYTTKFLKLKITDTEIGTQLLEDQFFEASVQGIPEEPWTNGCNWQTSFLLQIPNEWKSGFYTAQLIDDDGISFFIVFVVKPLETDRNKIALIANTNTWNAYNDWGGRSKYTAPPASTLSFFRPNPYCNPQDDGVINHLTRAELWVYSWIIHNDFAVDVYTDYDFHKGIENINGYSQFILSTHPEYWTATMLDNLENYLATGGNLIYIAGNGIFEKVEIIGDNEKLGMLNGDETQDRALSYFRNLSPSRPERAVLGIAYRYDNYMTFAPFETLMADHPLFEGTNLENGDLFGHSGLNGSVSGWEMDTSIAGTVPDGSIVGASGIDDRGLAPVNTLLLARGANPDFGADMTYYETAAGGFVFSAGSICIGGSLVVDEKLQTIMKNAINKAIS